MLSLRFDVRIVRDACIRACNVPSAPQVLFLLMRGPSHRRQRAPLQAGARVSRLSQLRSCAAARRSRTADGPPWSPSPTPCPLPSLCHPPGNRLPDSQPCRLLQRLIPDLPTSVSLEIRSVCPSVPPAIGAEAHKRPEPGASCSWWARPSISPLGLHTTPARPSAEGGMSPASATPLKLRTGGLPPSLAGGPTLGSAWRLGSGLQAPCHVSSAASWGRRVSSDA